jgi:hypothetical protein
MHGGRWVAEMRNVLFKALGSLGVKVAAMDSLLKKKQTTYVEGAVMHV